MISGAPTRTTSTLTPTTLRNIEQVKIIKIITLKISAKGILGTKTYKKLLFIS